ncbi:hypothetical protein HanIR_Chr12g0588651 [Helianthus annuus]|nr:hypothetical protein HanIR_Chr12g0588651 [Helianthus annuus]
MRQNSMINHRKLLKCKKLYTFFKISNTLDQKPSQINMINHKKSTGMQEIVYNHQN